MSEVQTSVKPAMRLSHTPGPWKLDGQFEAGMAIAIYAGDIEGDFTPVCELEPTYGEEWEPEEIANAHLISAGTELLASCKALLSIAEHCTAGDSSDVAIIQSARDVVAKAEGRA